MSDAAADGRPVVIVTGASGSIGHETMKAVARRNASVVAVDRQSLSPNSKRYASRELIVDLLDDSAVGRSFGTMADMRGLHHVISIAGGGDAEELSQPDPPTESLEVFSRVLANNLQAAFVTVRHAVPLLRRSAGDRSITLVGSINAFGGYGAPGYSAAKAGLIGLASALAPPLGKDGIRINCLALGTVDTENLRHLAEVSGVWRDLQAVADRTPLRRILTPSEVADALVALAFDMPGLTGSTLVLDNGQSVIR